MVEEKNKLELKKHVAAIHSNNKLSLLQRKIANALLFNAYEHLLDKEEHIIHIPTLCKLIGYDSNDHKTIKRSLVNLLSTVIEWNLVDGDKIDTEGTWNASSMIADASIEGATCTYSYSSKMKKLLYRPELYGRLNMLVQAKFRSTYGLALYENCIRYQNIEQTPWFELEQFRKLMGVDEGKYKIFRDFKNRVLNKAVDEVNAFSPICITPQFRKQGRQIAAVQFTIALAKQNGPRQLAPPLSSLLKTKFGLSALQIENYLSSYEEDYIREKIAIVESSSSYTSGAIKNLAKYFIAALKGDYQPIKKIAPAVRPSRPFEQGHRSEQAHKENYNRFRDKEIFKKFNALSKRKQLAVRKEFEKYIQKSLYYHTYQKEGLANLLVQDQLCRYIREQGLDFIRGLLSFTEYCALQQKIE